MSSWGRHGGRQDRPATVRPGGREEQGFTLLEVLLAMMIFAMIVTMIYTPYTGTFKMVNVTEPEAVIYQKARLALQRIVEDLESTYYNPLASVIGVDGEAVSQFAGQAGELDGRSADTLSFVSKAHLVFSDQEPDAGLARIRYEVRHDEELGGFLLLRSDVPDLLGTSGVAAMEGFILCDGLVSVRFSYFDEQGEENETWDSGAVEDGGAPLPRVVDIVLEFANESAPEAPLKFMTSVLLPISGTL